MAQCIFLLGDVVLADQEFTCQEYVGIMMAEVKLPPFTKGRKQLEKLYIDWSRELSIKRIHVKRVIGQLKQKYAILQSVLSFKQTLLVSRDECDSTIRLIIIQLQIKSLNNNRYD